MSRETSRLGKQGEYAVIGKLLEMGCDVYQPIVDTKRIDCVIRSEKGEYKEIQVKARSVSSEHGANIFSVRGFKDRANYFVILNFLGTSNYWVFPSRIFKKHGRPSKRTGSWQINLTEKKQYDLRRYRNNFDLLKK